MKRINPDLPEGIDGNLWFLMVADLRGLIWTHVDSDGGFKKLSEKAHLHEQTIVRFAYGETRSPFLSTVVKLRVAVDRVEQLVAAFKGASKPVTLNEAQKSRKQK